jgi:hypothetical protein
VKIIEIITEDRNWTRTAGKISGDQSDVLPGAHTVSGTSDKVYDLYRLGMTAAAADGVNPVKGNGESWIGRNNVTTPYTKEEADMLKSAYKANGIEWTDKLAPNTKNKSYEQKDVHIISPVAGAKWRKKRH